MIGREWFSTFRVASGRSKEKPLLIKREQLACESRSLVGVKSETIGDACTFVRRARVLAFFGEAGED